MGLDTEGHWDLRVRVYIYIYGLYIISGVPRIKCVRRACSSVRRRSATVASAEEPTSSLSSVWFQNSGVSNPAGSARRYGPDTNHK